ncbi:MAG: hypothetical protein ACRDQA_30380 [Nocardioidaceae bacterium]
MSEAETGTGLAVHRCDYAGPADLQQMQELAQRIWSPASRWHVGDLAWGRYSIPDNEPGWRTALWTADGNDRVVGWGWVELPGSLELLVDPAHVEVARDVLAWFDQVTDATSGVRTVTVLETEQHLMAALEQAGYAPRSGGPFFRHHHLSLEGLPEPVLPDGFRLRSVHQGEAELRAASHRAAWSDLGPSSVCTESYAAVMAAWPYRHDFDWVVEGPEGAFVANALGWLDEHNAVGLLEPVGCAPAYRRLGLARAANLAALRALRAAGARTAVVCPRGDDAYPVPGRLYRSIGFKPGARTVTYARPAPAAHTTRPGP